MATYQPLEIHRDGRRTGLWHYTVTDGGGSSPVGYCAVACPGHVSAHEACEHWRAYRVDTTIFQDEDLTQRKCEVCKVWTVRRAVVGGYGNFPRDVPLCPEHATLEAVRALPSTVTG